MFRRLTYLVPFVLVLVAVPLVTHAQVVNLLEDPSFEDEIIIGNTAWNRWLTWAAGGAVNSTIEIDKTEFMDGEKSLRVIPSGTGQFAVIYAAIPLTVGERYTVSFWAKAEAPRTVQARLQAMNNSSMETADFELTIEWAEYTFTAEATNASIKLQIQWDAGVEVPYWLDFVSLYAGEYVAGIEPSGWSQVMAADPDPADGAADVPRDVVLSWTPGEYANTHDVYFGNSFEDVNAATNLDPMGSNEVFRAHQDADSYAVDERLGFGQTYYWRIDEVNAPPNATIFKGDVWSFTAEPEGVPLTSDLITATASSVDSNQIDPNATINRAGLDEKDLHNDEKSAMWLCSVDDPEPWIQYDFDRAYKLHEMKVWNHNSDSESTLGYGIQQARIETSVDGETWTELDGLQTFNQAPGTPGYAANTTGSLGGVIAQAVRITALSNWSPWPEFITQKGLSEVQFSYIPVWARKPDPDSGATDADVDAVLSFRAGREAATHDVYLSTDEQAVIDGTAPVVTVTEASYASSLDLASTYYWRVDEVNDAETPTIWQGDLWNFTTQEFIVVDDFEGFDVDNPIWETWLDGLGFGVPGTPGFNPGNGTGAAVGNENSPSYMEETIVHGGNKSIPFGYNNAVAGVSEVIRTFTPAQDWTVHGVKTLSLWFAGDGANVPGQLYVKVNGVQIDYDGDAGNLALAGWQPWNIDLTAINTNLGNVTSLAIGIQGPGATGTLLLDDIRLYSYDRQFVTPVDPGMAGLQAHYEFEGNTNDSSGNARHGTAAGNPIFGEGRIGQAIGLDGLGDYVNIDGYKGVLGSSAITVTAWIKTNSTDTGAIVGWGPDVSGERFGFRVDLGRLRAEHAGGNVQGDTLVNDGGWHHVAVTVRENVTISYPDVILYLDGADDTRPTTDADPVFNVTAAEDVSIGRRPSVDDRYFIGQIDEVRIYDRALTQEEVAWLVGRIVPFDKPF